MTQVRAIQVGDVPPDVKGRTLADIEGKEGSGAVYTSSFFIGLLVQPKPGLFISQCGLIYIDSI
jgi:poly(A) polymerase